MVVVAMTVVIILLGSVDKLLVWATSIINIAVVVEVLAIGVLADVEIIVLGVIVIVLKFVLPVTYSVDVSSGVDIDLFMDALVSVMIGVLTGIGIEVLAAMGVNTFAAITLLKCPMGTPLEEFSL